MGVADKLAAKTAGVVAKAIDASQPPMARSDAHTSPGRLMDVQNNLARIRDLEAQLAQQTEQEVRLDDLVEVKGRRRRLTPEQYSELKKNLDKHPLVTPILFRRLSTGKKEIVAGHNRVAIFRELGRTTIRALEVQVADDQIAFAAFHSNLLSPSLTDFEKYENFKQLQETSGLSKVEISESVGLSASHITRIFSFDSLPEEAKLILSDKPERLGSTAAQELAALAQTGHAAKVIEAVKRLVEDEKFSQKQAVSFVKAKPKAAATEVAVIKAGKRKVCEVSSRNGVIGLRFFDEDGGHALAEQWARKITDFVTRGIETDAKK